MHLGESASRFLQIFIATHQSLDFSLTDARDR